jgi:hypothetical protein
MKFEYTKLSFEGEPGPNFIFHGNRLDFEKLAMSIEGLLIDDLQVTLGRDIENGISVVAISSRTGNILSYYNSGELVINLPRELWEQLFLFANALSKKEGFFYVEFDDLDLIFNCNLIWSCES